MNMEPPPLQNQLPFYVTQEQFVACELRIMQRMHQHLNDINDMRAELIAANMHMQQQINDVRDAVRALEHSRDGRVCYYQFDPLWNLNWLVDDGGLSLGILSHGVLDLKPDLGNVRVQSLHDHVHTISDQSAVQVVILVAEHATGACEKFPSHVPCAFVNIPTGEIVEIFSLSGDGTFKTGATLELKIGDEHTWHAVDALRRDMIKKWFDVDEAVFLPPRTITVLVPRYTTIYDTSDAGEGTCSLSCTTGDTPLHVGDRIGLIHHFSPFSWSNFLLTMNLINVLRKCESECKRTGASPTHTAMNGGKYYVAANAYDEFMSAYIEAINAGKFLSIVEQHRYIGPAIVDIDLRQSEPTRIYDDADVRLFVKAFFKKLAKYVVVPENTQCFVLEKEKPRESNIPDTWKDGVHLVVPDVVTHPCIQQTVRKDMLTNWKSFGDDYLNDPSDMYDEAVIERNGWLMYGSKKPEETSAWQVAYTVSKDGKVTEGCELSPGELVERLSIRNKYMETALTTEGLQNIQDDQEERVKKEIDRRAATEEVYCDFADDDESWMMLDSLCALLGEERSKTRTNWMNVGWALNNIPVGESIARRMLWKRFGMLCPTKYDDGEHDRKWSNMGPPRQGPSALGIGSLRMWAKEDNPDEYKKWSSVHKAPAQNSTQRRPAATTTEVEGPLTPTQNQEIKLDAVARELEEMTCSDINKYVELKNGSITFRNAEGIDGTIDRNRYIVKLGSQCHGAMPKTFTMPKSALEFLNGVPRDCSFDAKLETSNSEISGVTMKSKDHEGLEVKVCNVNSGNESIIVYMRDAKPKFINGKSDIKKTMDIVYKQQEMAMQNRFGINQQIFINNGTVNNIIVRSEDDPDYVVMLDQMLEFSKDRRLMKGNGNVYEPIESCPCAYRVLCDYEEYVNKSLKHNPETYKMLRMHPSRGKSCVEYMRFLTEEESMPQYTVDKDLLSFSNGVLCLSDMRFVPYDGDTSSVMGKVARHHVDCDYTASTDTPIIDKILETNFDGEVASMFYAMVGRLFFEVGKHDDWQVMPYMIGVGGTGKSVLLNTITSCFAEDAVGNLSSKREEVFGSANIFDKEVVVGCDMPAEMSSCIPQVSFQSMTSGDRLEIPRKKEKAVFIKWTTPIIIASNYTPDYKDTGDNIGRRIVSFRFDVAVPKAERDYGLKAKIMETGEIANFIHRALVEYDALRKRIRGDFWTAVPPIMIDWQSRLAVATNKLHEFLSMDNEDRQYNIEHIEGATTLLSTFKTVYKNVMQCTFEKDAGVFQRFGFRCSDTKVNVCKSCSKVSGKGCCVEYSATNRAQRVVIVNMKLSSDGDDIIFRFH
eukprot:gene957-biopygen2286